VELAEELRTAGHEAATVGDQLLVGTNDRNLSEVCNTKSVCIMT
jgi:hypothetical protein